MPELLRTEDLPPLRVEKGVVASAHRYSGPLSAMKIRLRVLEEDKESDRSDLLKVLEDRTLSWQEKITPPPEKLEAEAADDTQSFIYTLVDTEIRGRRQKVWRWKGDLEEGERGWEDLEEEAGESETEDADKDEEAEQGPTKDSEDKENLPLVVGDKRRTLLLEKEEASFQALLQGSGRRPSASLSSTLLHPSEKGEKVKSPSKKEEKKQSLQRATKPGPLLQGKGRRGKRIALRSQNMAILAALPSVSK